MKRNRITQTVRAGIDSDTQHGSVMPPLYLSTNYSFEGLGGKREYDYSRSGNPTRDQLGDAIAQLENGTGAVITNTGMSAVVLPTFLLGPNDTIVAPHNCYGGCYRAFDSLANIGRFKTRFLDFCDLDALRRQCREIRPRIIWVETPSNPLLRVTDIRRVATIARECGALLVVDNTFLTPLGQQPLDLGADIVVHSTTKYINGHSDVVGGAVVARESELLEQLAWWANCVGSTASPWDCSQVMRGLRTLHARLRCHEENVAEVATALDGHPAVKQVNWPGLKSHPDHALATSQQDLFGSIVSFELAGGEAQVRAFLDGLKFFTLAESLGGVESLVCHPGSMTHAAMSEEAQAEAGIAPTLLRLSVGIERAADLVADLAAGLERAQQSLQLPEGVARLG
ncbi:cystathionine gamma-synthase [Marinihelvus fidelis]|uniref:Cystathionine gamma-synthase n=1 Tax=Marinihelvus fidelis TaxID=2613842 RepID=A0A5N0TH98_9GAMM|nr:cystathionine gamma-synthase [Marinihelvus fidelis]KAA9133206.1 cystathionine gamma-synthase [Marinihelvus fidelis]